MALRRLFTRPRVYASAGYRQHPDRIVIEPRADAVPNGRPTVRIFLGTEPAQWRAERVFVWSILQVRDPSRRYEIYRMCDLAGFDRSDWTTGFTNYRFAIPAYAGGQGPAIYNDVDQIYLSDPARLFDLDMNGHGFLAIAPVELSVMLIDCRRMLPVWPLLEAQHERAKAMREKAIAAGLYGPCAREWNARDEEYEPGRSHLLHYSTLHTQPWQPMPDLFIYQRSQVADVWRDLERSADDAGFLEFTEERPSDSYTALACDRGAKAAVKTTPTAEIAQTIREWNATSLLVFGPDASHCCEDISRALGRAVRVQSLDPVLGGTAEPCDIVACVGGFDRLPEEDVPWLMRKAFRLAKVGVYVDVREDPGGRARRRGADWWHWHMLATGNVTPWRLVFRSVAAPGLPAILHGDLPTGEARRTWVLADDRFGNRTQSLGLAEQLGTSYEVKDLRFNGWVNLHLITDQLLSESALTVDRAASSPLEPPWPDLVIAAGRRTAPVARWIRKQSGGRTRVVMLGRKGGHRAELFDVVVTPIHSRLPPHPRRIETVVPLTHVTAARLAEEAKRWPDLFAGHARPLVVLLVGGATARHVFDAETASQLGREIRAAAGAIGATVTAVTSPRSGSAVALALRSALGEGHRVIDWKPNGAPNPYLACLDAADILVVTGDSESMLGEAVATNKPVYIYPLPVRPLTMGMRLKEWVVQRAKGKPSKFPGTMRAQQGLEYACAWLIDTGLVRPSRDLTAMYDAMVRTGMARMFIDSVESYPSTARRETDRVVRNVRLLLGLGIQRTPPSAAVDAADHPRERATASALSHSR